MTAGIFGIASYIEILDVCHDGRSGEISPTLLHHDWRRSHEHAGHHRPHVPSDSSLQRPPRFHFLQEVTIAYKIFKWMIYQQPIERSSLML